MGRAYDAANHLDHLLIQYDTNATFGTTVLSNVIAMDFVDLDGSLVNLIPASLIYHS